MTSIDEKIDEIPMHEMTGDEALKLLDPNSLAARVERRDTRYFMYCLRSKAEKNKVLPDSIPVDFALRYENQIGFDGWINFATTWDVSLHDASIVVSRAFSEVEEWERVLHAKFPQIQPDGSVKYPDMRVKEAIDTELKEQGRL